MRKSPKSILPSINATQDYLTNCYRIRHTIMICIQSPGFEFLRHAMRSSPGLSRLVDGLEVLGSEAKIVERLHSLRKTSEALSETALIARLIDFHLESMGPEISLYLFRIASFAQTFYVPMSSVVLKCPNAQRYVVELENRGFVRLADNNRLHLLEFVRPLLLLRLSRDERREIDFRYDNYYRDLIHKAGAFLRQTPDPVWMKRLDDEAPEILTFLNSSSSELPGLLASLWRWWLLKRPVMEGIELINTALGNSVGSEVSNVTVGLWRALGLFWRLRGNYRMAIDILERAVIGAHELSDRMLLMESLLYLGITYRDIGHLENSNLYLKQAHQIAVTSQEKWAIGAAESALGINAWQSGNLKEAQEHFEKAAGLYKELCDVNQASRVLLNLGLVAEAKGNICDAEMAFRRSLACARKCHDYNLITECMHNLAGSFFRLDKLDESERFYRDALERMCKIGYVRNAPLVIFNLGCIAFKRGAFSRAIVLIAAAARLREKYASAWTQTVIDEYQAILESMRDQVNIGIYANCHNRGAAMNLKQVLAFIK